MIDLTDGVLDVIVTSSRLHPTPGRWHGWDHGSEKSWDGSGWTISFERPTNARRTMCGADRPVAPRPEPAGRHDEMDLTPYLDAVRVDLEAVSGSDEATSAVAERLARALEPSLQLRLLDTL